MCTISRKNKVRMAVSSSENGLCACLRCCSPNKPNEAAAWNTFPAFYVFNHMQIILSSNSKQRKWFRDELKTDSIQESQDFPDWKVLAFNVKCQMSIGSNFCRSVPPKLLRSFFSAVYNFEIHLLWSILIQTLNTFLRVLSHHQHIFAKLFVQKQI